VIPLENQNTQLQLVDYLMSWDPYQLGEGQYDTEIADVIQAVYTTNSEHTLAKKVKEIFEYSFEKHLPMKDCEEVAKQLLMIKNKGSCTF